jgi:hypothetical protein
MSIAVAGAATIADAAPSMKPLGPGLRAQKAVEFAFQRIEGDAAHGCHLVLLGFVFLR